VLVPQLEKKDEAGKTEKQEPAKPAAP
jgi:hypothetical protein